jgi:hypothetical protein
MFGRESPQVTFGLRCDIMGASTEPRNHGIADHPRTRHDQRAARPHVPWARTLALSPIRGQAPDDRSQVDESYCKTEDPEGPSEEIPGICTVRTPEGQPCTSLLECTWLCTDGVCERLPVRLCETLEAWWAREWM